jgi:predicted transcriptional regulator
MEKMTKVSMQMSKPLIEAIENLAEKQKCDKSRIVVRAITLYEIFTEMKPGERAAVKLLERLEQLSPEVSLSMKEGS